MKMSSTVRLVALCCAAFIPFIANAAWADDGAAAPDEIIITGLRTPVALGEMASAVTVIDRAALDLRQSFQLADILRDVPGMTIARSGPVGSQAQVRMRGTEANHVLVLIDGVEANDPASGDEFLFEHLSALEVERVEIIRGPQSALWGSDAVAGVINIVTRQGAEGASGGGSFEGGANNTWRQSLRAGWGAEKWDFNAGVSRSESDGTNVSRFGSEDDGYELTTVQTRLSLMPNDTWDITLSARHVEAENETDPVDWILNLPVDGDRETQVNRSAVNVVARGTFDTWNHRFGISWFDSENESFVDRVLDSTSNAQRLKVSLQSTIEVKEGHRVTGALDYRETDFTQTGTATLWGDPNQVQSIKDTGVVLDYVGAFTDALTVSGSVRFDDHSDYEDIATYKLGASYDLNERTRIRGSFGRGFKAPTFTDRFGFTADTFQGNPDLRPEVSDSVEVGIDYEARGSGAIWGITLFKARLEDEINGFYFDPDTFMFTAINKTGESRRHGGEVTLDAQLSDYVTLSANYTWTHSEEPDDMGGYRAEIRRPEHSGAVSLTRVWDNGVSMALNASLIGKADDLDFASWPARVVTLKAYGLIGVTAQAPLNDQAQIYARIQKPTDDSYEDVYGFATPNIDFALGLRMSF